MPEVSSPERARPSFLGRLRSKGAVAAIALATAGMTYVGYGEGVDSVRKSRHEHRSVEQKYERCLNVVKWFGGQHGPNRVTVSFLDLSLQDQKDCGLDWLNKSLGDNFHVPRQGDV